MLSLKDTLEKVRIVDTPNGKGLFANDALPAGTAITAVHGEHLSFEETLGLGDKESFCVQIGVKDYVLPAPPFYFCNHACEPNCGLIASLELVTLRDLAKDEELFWDYSTSMLERHWVMECNCQTAGCRGVVRDFDLLPKPLREKYLGMNIVLPYIVEYLNQQTALGTTRV